MLLEHLEERTLLSQFAVGPLAAPPGFAAPGSPPPIHVPPKPTPPPDAILRDALGESRDARYARYMVTWANEPVSWRKANPFYTWAPETEFQEIVRVAKAYETKTPGWSWGNQCYEQNRDLQLMIANQFKPWFWTPGHIGGSYRVMEVWQVNHNVVSMGPTGGNQLPARYIDGFKQMLIGGNLSWGLLSSFQAHYPDPVAGGGND